MAAEGGNNIVWFLYTGQENIPDNATHVFVDAAFIPRRAFYDHPNVVEVICHDRVEKIEEEAFHCCPFLRRVIMPGVKILEYQAFAGCAALTDVECGKLEIIGIHSFSECESLGIINLPSVKNVQRAAFDCCKALTDVKFSNKLETIEDGAFSENRSLERITIPLKDGLFTEAEDGIFAVCDNLKHVDLVGGALNETVSALHLEGWRNDMSREIDSINQILPNTPAGKYEDFGDNGEKAQVIQTWIRSVIDKMNHYKAEHQRVLSEAATLLELAVWKANLDDNNGGRTMSVREGVRTTRGSVKRARRELCVTSGASIVIKNVLPFLELKA